MRRLFFALAMAAVLGAAEATPITPAVEYTSTDLLSDSGAYTLGYSFSLNAPVSLNALGYWADGQPYSHAVGVWNAGGTLLTSATVQAADTLQGHFRWHGITPIILAAGTYTIGGQTYEGGNAFNFPFNPAGLSTMAGYTWLTDEQNTGSGLVFPHSATYGGYGVNGLLLVSFSATASSSGEPIPEPASLALVCAALAGFAAARRRRA